MPFDVTCTNEQRAIVIVTPLTDEGNPAVVEPGSLVVTLLDGDGSVLPIDPAFPNQFKAVSGTLLADSRYTVTADADTGPGVRTISDIVTLHVTSAQAKNFGFAAGAVESKTAA